MTSLITTLVLRAGLFAASRLAVATAYQAEEPCGKAWSESPSAERLKIWAESTLGEASTFHVTIPVAAPRAP